MQYTQNAEEIRYKDLYKEGADLLAGILEPGEARLDARLLLEFVCGTELQTLLLDKDRPVSAQDAAKYRELLKRRLSREPLAYITGTGSFMGLTLEVGSEVLIPRQDTENLVEEIMKESCDGERILDLCTGSGCILLSLLHYSNSSTGVGTDLSEKAVKTAEKNAAGLGLEERSEFRCGDLFEVLAEDEKFDIIVSNPPYIRSEILPELAPEVIEHEPAMALDGGADGLDFYRRIIPEAASHLTGGGMLYLEIGYDQGEAVSALMAEAGYYDVKTIRDYGGNDRIVRGIKSVRRQ